MRKRENAGYTHITPNLFFPIPKIFVKQTCTVFGQNGRINNLLLSVYELKGWFRTGRVLQNFEPAQDFLPSIPSYN